MLAQYEGGELTGRHMKNVWRMAASESPASQAEEKSHYENVTP